MTPEETKAAAQVMLAAEYDDFGRCTNIEFESMQGTWDSISFPTWGWYERKYRIKPRPELKKGQIIEVSDDLLEWKLRRVSQNYGCGVFAYDGIKNDKHDVFFRYWRLPE
jgi:hypothetical protein